jgi:hypothetical protein
MSPFIEATSEGTFKAFATDAAGNTGVWNFSSHADAERWAAAWENHDLNIVGSGYLDAMSDRELVASYRLSAYLGAANKLQNLANGSASSPDTEAIIHSLMGVPGIEDILRAMFGGVFGSGGFDMDGLSGFGFLNRLFSVVDPALVFSAVTGRGFSQTTMSVVVYVWDGDLIPNPLDSRGMSFGHVMITDLAGNLILSQYPRDKQGNPSDIWVDKDDNTPFFPKETFREQDRAPSKVFRVDGLRRDDLLSTANDHRSRNDWNPFPVISSTQTHCSFAGYHALRAGGLMLEPRIFPSLPIGLGHDLAMMSTTKGSGVASIRWYP